MGELEDRFFELKVAILKQQLNDIDDANRVLKHYRREQAILSGKTPIGSGFVDGKEYPAFSAADFSG